MSSNRWQDAFENHPFQPIWKEVLAQIEDIRVDDESVTSDVEEVARLVKAIRFIDELIKNCDAQIVPLSIWQNFHSQLKPCSVQINAFVSNRNVAHILKANDHVDNLLTYVRPTLVATGNAARAMSASFNHYNKAINSALDSFIDTSSERLDEINIMRDKARETTSEIDSIFISIQNVEQYLFGTDEEVGVESKVEELFSSITEKHGKINEYHSLLFIGDEEHSSLSLQIKDEYEEIQTSKEKIELLLSDSKSKVEYLKSFYTNVYGSENDDGKIISGLKYEINSRINSLDEFKVKQEQRYNTLNTQIEKLLPQATSAGLASAYYVQRKSFNRSIKTFSCIFYLSMLGLFICSVVFALNELNATASLESIIIGLFKKIPFVIPIIWLALFASKRRNEHQRLQQEYAHKEAIAKSYQSFKYQIEQLGDTDTEMMKSLLNKAIDAIAFNASTTLDKKHDEATPPKALVDKVAGELEKRLSGGTKASS